MKKGNWCRPENYSFLLQKWGGMEKKDQGQGRGKGLKGGNRLHRKKGKKIKLAYTRLSTRGKPTEWKIGKWAGGRTGGKEYRGHVFHLSVFTEVGKKKKRGGKQEGENESEKKRGRNPPRENILLYSQQGTASKRSC